jgi:hypothetical protein
MNGIDLYFGSSLMLSLVEECCLHSYTYFCLQTVVIMYEESPASHTYAAGQWRGIL